MAARRSGGGASSSEHSSDVLAEAQKLVLSLTAEVKKLREERRNLNNTVDSLTTNCTQLRQEVEQQRQTAAAEAALAQTEVSTIQQLNAALEEKAEKLQLLVQLNSLKRQAAEEGLVSLHSSQQQHAREAAATLKGLQRKHVKRASAVGALKEEKATLLKYAAALEEEVQQQWQLRCDEVRKRQAQEHEMALAMKEISILKVLGVNNPAELLSLAPDASTREKYLVLKAELQRASEFLRSAVGAFKDK